MTAQPCNSWHPQAAAQAARGLLIQPCHKESGHDGRCVFLVDYIDPLWLKEHTVTSGEASDG